MRIQGLKLSQFRGFEALELFFDPQVTVLVGENGAGKTNLVRALQAGLSALFLDFGVSSGAMIAPEDIRAVTRRVGPAWVREPQLGCEVALNLTLAGEALSFLVNGAPRSPARHWLAEQVRSGDNSAILPLVAVYGPSRPELITITRPLAGLIGRLDGYRGALSTRGDSQATPWLYQRRLIELQEGSPDPLLACVSNAVAQCTEAERFFFNVKTQTLELWRGQEVIPFGALSHGYQNMVALVVDLAWRAAVLNPQLGDQAAALTPGVVVVDEVDLHLHPRWQRVVLGALQRAFPLIQWVVTTHSPQVLASVQRQQLRILQDGQLLSERPFIEGRESNGILEDVFQVGSRPEAAEAALHRLAELVDGEHYAEAKKLLADLETQQGPEDPALRRARWQLDLEAP